MMKVLAVAVEVEVLLATRKVSVVFLELTADVVAAVRVVVQVGETVKLPKIHVRSRSHQC